MSLKLRGRSSFQKRRDMQWFIMCVPALLKVLIFSYVPMLGIIIAFQFYMPRLGFLYSPFVWFDNFSYLFKSSVFVTIFKNTVVLNLLFSFFGLVFSVFFGILMFHFTSKLMLKFTQTIFLFPYFIAWTVAGTLLGAVIGDEGFLSPLFQVLGGPDYDIYEHPEWWPMILTFMHVWKGVGIGTITYYAVLLSQDKEIYEAAALDGAGRFTRVVKLMLPSLKYMIVVNTVMSTANLLRMDFQMIYFLTGNRSLLYPTTDVIETYMFRALRTNGDYSVGAATGLAQGVFGCILAVLANRIVKWIDKSSSLF